MVDLGLFGNLKFDGFKQFKKEFVNNILDKLLVQLMFFPSKKTLDLGLAVTWLSCSDHSWPDLKGSDLTFYVLSCKIKPI